MRCQVLVVVLLGCLLGGFAQGRRFSVCMASGDGEVVAASPVWRAWRARALFAGVTPAEVSVFRRGLEEELRGRGYVFARVETPEETWAHGIFVARVDCGVWGRVELSGAGRHYRREWLLSRLGTGEERFDYEALRRRLAALNAGADLRVEAKLSPMERDGRRQVDAEFVCTEQFPLHGGLALGNTTPREAEATWRWHGWLEERSLTGHGDTLALHYLTDGDVGESVNAVFATYRLEWDEQWSLALHGSWSDADYSEALPGVAVNGRGHAFGASVERKLDGEWYLLAGWRVARTRNRLGLDGETEGLSAATISMPYVGIGCAAREPDAWRGLHSWRMTLGGSRHGWFGASRQEAFQREGTECDGAFCQLHLEGTRLQRLDADGQWTLWMRAQCVYSDDVLPSGLKEYLGGGDTIRGYRESEAGGDCVLSGTLELRTPLLEEALAERRVDDPLRQRLQALLFVDGGHVRSRGESFHKSLVGVGAGLRLALGRWGQAAVDYGLPLVRHVSEETPSGGRVHVSVQVQF